MLIDHSAWARLGQAHMPDDRRQALVRAFAAGEVGICLPFLLEAGFSARSAREHAELLEELLAFPQVDLTPAAGARAIEAQSDLARAGHHRLPPVDLLVAALADVNGLGVIHYDRDFDVILEHTVLRFESAWLAPRGSL